MNLLDTSLRARVVFAGMPGAGIYLHYREIVDGNASPFSTCWESFGRISTELEEHALKPPGLANSESVRGHFAGETVVNGRD
jgi:hypothetical protein